MSTESSVAAGAGAGAAFGPWGALAGGILGGILGSRQQKQQEKARQEQAMINMYSPLFGKSPEALGMRHDYTTSGLMSGVTGGYSIGTQLEDYLRKREEVELAKANGSATSSAAPVTSAQVFVPYAGPAPQQMAPGSSGYAIPPQPMPVGIAPYGPNPYGV